MGGLAREAAPRLLLLRKTYLRIYESSRGQEEGRQEANFVNVSLAGLRLKVHPQQQVVEARVVAPGHGAVW